MSNRKWRHAFKDTGWIRREHGLIVWLAYWFTGIVSLVTISHWARWPRDKWPVVGYTHDKETGKTKPWLQDSVALFLLILSLPVLYLYWCNCTTIPKLWVWFSAYLILDPLSRHVRIMWFDDLEPGIKKIRRKVWSHRRILFLAILSYGQSIFLFTPLLQWVDFLRQKSFWTLWERSFGTATLTSLPHALTKVDVVQVLVSLFYLAIVVATTASIAYKRREVASDP